MDDLSNILSICYFLGMATAILKALRYWVDRVTLKRRRYLWGVLANVALALAWLFILLRTGHDPRWDSPSVLNGLRLFVMLWAILGQAFELAMLPTWLKIKPREQVEQIKALEAE